MKQHANILDWFVRHKVAGNLLMMAMIIGGLVALSKLNVQFFPRFDLDMIYVTTVWKGASAEDIETSITTPLEQTLRTVDGLRKLDSTSEQGLSGVLLEFKEGSDIVLALNQVKQHVDEFRNLPQDAEQTEVVHLIAYEPVLRLLLSGSDNLAELRQLANTFERELLDRGIANIQLLGLPEEELAIEIDSQQLSRLGMSVDELAKQIAQQSSDLPAGTAGDQDNTRQLRTLDQRRDPTAFSRMMISSDAQTRVQLGKIATIERRPQSRGTTLSSGGQHAVEMVIRRSPQGDALAAAEIVQRWLEETQPSLPQGIELQAFDNQYLHIVNRIKLLLRNGLSGLVLLIIILYLFLAPKVAFWVAVGIPVSFLATMLVHYLAGGTIDMLSLFAFIMALGVIVDDAIVVGEEALSEFENGADPVDAAYGGVSRMFAPVLASSLTTIGAFMPLMAIGGPTGKILFALPMVMVSVVTASLIESMFVLPAHLRSTFTSMSSTGHRRLNFNHHFNDFRERRFRPFIRLALRYRDVTLSLILAFFIISIGVLASGRVPFSFFPSPDGTIFYANAKFMPGTSKQEVRRFMEYLEQTILATDQALSDKPIVLQAITRYGSTSGEENGGTDHGDHFGSMMLEVLDPDERTVQNLPFIQAVKDRVVYPPGLANLTIRQQMVGPPGRDVSVRLLGASASVLKQAAQALAADMKEIPGIINIDDDMPFGREQWVFSLSATGEKLGLTSNELARQLRAVFDGRVVQRFQDGPDEVEVRVLLAAVERAQLSTLERINLQLADGNRVPLMSVANWQVKQGFEVLRHAEAALAVEVKADVDRAASTVDQALQVVEQQLLPRIEQQFGVQAAFAGRAAEEAETMSDMKYGLVIGLTLIYLVLTAVFSSYGLPFVVMTAIPFGLIGALFGHWLLNIDMTILSMFGLFGLSGIIVNDSIILATCYKEIRAGGMAIDLALEEAACQRLRAVLLTSLTTIAGLTPLLFETSMQAKFLIPMAASIAFGLAFGTILVLFFIPVLLSVYEHIQAWILAIKTRDHA